MKHLPLFDRTSCMGSDSEQMAASTTKINYLIDGYTTSEAYLCVQIYSQDLSLGEAYSINK